MLGSSGVIIGPNHLNNVFLAATKQKSRSYSLYPRQILHSNTRRHVDHICRHYQGPP